MRVAMRSLGEGPRPEGIPPRIWKDLRIEPNWSEDQAVIVDTNGLKLAHIHQTEFEDPTVDIGILIEARLRRTLKDHPMQKELEDWDSYLLLLHNRFRGTA